MVMILLYLYQTPIISTSEAISNVEEYLQNPPKELGESISNLDIEENSLVNSGAYLHEKSGYWNKLMNRQQWEVVVAINGNELTAVIDAYTGELIEFIGPLN